MAKQHLVIDSWIREAQEAATLVEEIDSRIKSKNVNEQQRRRLTSYDHDDDLSMNIHIARSKLMEVGVKVDRLESLLHNPPSKPILTNEDLEFRWEMLSNIQLTAKELAVSLYAMPSSTFSRQGALPAGDTKEIDKGDSSYDHSSTRQMQASSPKDEPELLQPLVSDSTHSHMETKGRSNFACMSMLWKICRTIILILGAAALLFLLVIICAVI